MPEVPNEIIGVSRALPPQVPDTLAQYGRGNGYGDKYVVGVQNTKHGLADEGSYFVATNPTPSTPVAYGSGGTQATYDATTALLAFKNGDSASSLKRMYLDYIRLIVGGTVPASATSTQYAITIDNGDRTPSANATLITAKNVLMASSRAPIGKVWCPLTGIPTIPAASGSARLVARGSLKTAISVVLDEYILRFGPVDGPGVSALGSGVGHYVNDAPPIVLGPGEFALLHVWQPSGATNPLSVEFEAAWWER